MLINLCYRTYAAQNFTELTVYIISDAYQATKAKRKQLLLVYWFKITMK